MTDRISFAQLYDALTALGLHVGVRNGPAGHEIVVCDPSADRVVRLGVHGCFDRAAAVLVASMRLRETIGGLPRLMGLDREVRGEWPEFEQLWPLEFRAGAD